MNRLRLKFYVLAMSALTLVLCTTPVQAHTAQQIVDSVIDELDNVSDYTPSVDVDYDDASIDDMTDGSLQWKRNSQTWKSKMVAGSPYSDTYVTDGDAWNIHKGSGYTYYFEKDDYDPMIRVRFGTDMFNMENILDTESWSVAGSTEYINNVECYMLYTGGPDTYNVWIDYQTTTQVIRVKSYVLYDTLQWQLDYSSYSNVENTAQLPAEIVTKRYFSGQLHLTSTYSFSEIDINEGLSNSIFDLDFIPE